MAKYGEKSNRKRRILAESARRARGHRSHRTGSDAYIARDKEMKKESTLTNWTIEQLTGYVVLRGDVVNDLRWEDGTPVRTSMVERVDFVKGIAETKNTIYHLA
jgi:hypothetical protein